MAVRFDASGDRYQMVAGRPSSKNVWTITCLLWLSVDRNTYSSVWGYETEFVQTASNGDRLELWNQNSARRQYATLTPNRWYRLGVAVDGNTAISVFGPLDGNLATTSTGWSVKSGSYDTRSYIGSCIYSSEWWNGRIAAFKAWDATLSAAEMTDELAQFAPVRTASLLRYHPFHVAETTDHSGNGNHLDGGNGASTEPDPDIPESSSIPIQVSRARTATRADTPVLTQAAALSVAEVRSPGHIQTPLLTAPLILSVNGTRTGTVASSPTTGHTYRLRMRGVRARARAGSPVLVSGLTVFYARIRPRAEAPLLVAPLILAVGEGRSTPRADEVDLAQRHPPLAVGGSRSAGAITDAPLTQTHALLVPGVRTDTAASAAALAQHSALTAVGLRGLTRVQSPLVTLLPGIAVRIPTTVRLLTGPAAVATPDPARVAILSARGAVRETY